MISKALTQQITYIGANDSDIKLFENIWPIDQGISYNCYLIDDKQTVLIDTVEKNFSDELLDQLKTILSGRALDYLVINHMEPDHSGTIKAIVEQYPELTIVGNHKTAVFLEGFYDIAKDKVKQVKTGDSLKIGQHQLQFHQTPMVHWPESMVCYETKTKTLFSSDIFGGYKTVNDQPMADQRNDLDEFIDQARSYFATVIGGYTRPAARALKQLNKLEIETIAPAHGLVWQKKSKLIMDLYQNWAQYQTDEEADDGVTVIVGSMYGHTFEIGSLLKKELEKSGLKVDLLDASQDLITDQLGAVWKNKGLIIGSCTYSNGLLPQVKSLLDALEDRKIQNKVVGVFSSHSWTGGAMRHLQQFAQDSKLTLVEPQFETQYKMRAESEKSAEALAQAMVAALKKTE